MNKFFWLGALGLAYWAWHKHQNDQDGGMSARDAARLLNVSRYADAATISAAHKRIIAQVHPDVGGTEEAASRVNQARDVLLRRLSR